MQVTTKLENASIAKSSVAAQNGNTPEPLKEKFNAIPYFYALPALLVMTAVVLYPFIYNVIVSFSNMNLEHFQDWRFKGLSNYINVLSDSKFWWFLFKTVLWTVTNVFFHVTIGVFLAILLNKNIKAKNFFRVILILPWAVPQYITALNWRAYLIQNMVRLIKF